MGLVTYGEVQVPGLCSDECGEEVNDPSNVDNVKHVTSHGPTHTRYCQPSTAGTYLPNRGVGPTPDLPRSGAASEQTWIASTDVVKPFELRSSPFAAIPSRTRQRPSATASVRRYSNSRVQLRPERNINKWSTYTTCKMGANNQRLG